MASKKDLVEGQSFSRRRLITAFVSGAPAGREVEPGKPLRAVVGGVLLSVILVVGALAVGLLSPTLPDGWDTNSLVIAKDTGARYVAQDGTLYPVINTASARLLIRSDFKVISANADKFTDTPRGPTVGIVGAPDTLPATTALIDTGWTSCISRENGIVTTLSARPDATAVADQAVVVSTGDASYLVDNGTRYRIPDDSVDAVRRVLALDTTPVYAVDGRWLNLFAAGEDLGPLTVAGAGQPVAGLPAGVTVGSTITGGAGGSGARRYVVEQDGSINPLSDVAYAMYRLGSGAAQGTDVTVNPDEIGRLRTGAPVAPTSWPAAVPDPIGEVPCAVLKSAPGNTAPSVALGVSTSATPPDRAAVTAVDPGAGALVRAVGAASIASGTVYLVDPSGTAYPLVADADTDPVGQLGYTTGEIVAVPQAWVGLLDVGPTLSYDAARTTVGTGSR